MIQTLLLTFIGSMVASHLGLCLLNRLARRTR